MSEHSITPRDRDEVFPRVPRIAAMLTAPSKEEKMPILAGKAGENDEN